MELISQEIKLADHELAKTRSKWLDMLKLEGKAEKLFELEVLLKGIDRFFNLQNLPLNSEDTPIRLNFTDEISIACLGFARITEISRRFLEASERSYYQFRYYVESELLGDLARSRVIEHSLSQKTPEESLMLIYSSFLGLKNLCSELSRLKEVRYPLFFHLGSLTSHAIVQSKFFNPITMVEFRPEFDQVANRVVKRAVRGIADQATRHSISVVILAFYRLLHYLGFIDQTSDDNARLKQSLIIFALINSEARHLIGFLEMDLRPQLEKHKNEVAQEFSQLADALGFQFNMELRKINNAELVGASKRNELDPLKTAVDNSKGVLGNFLMQSVVQMVQALDPDIKGEEIFPDFISRRQQSNKLREELAVFKTLMDKFEEITESSVEGASLKNFIKYLMIQRSYIKYIEKHTAPLIRYGDLVEFRKYFVKINALTPDDLHRMDKLEEFKMESKFFKIFLETTLGHICQRAELQCEPLDEKRIQARLKLFVARGMLAAEKAEPPKIGQPIGTG
jgi:hypothetical protein